MRIFSIFMEFSKSVKNILGVQRGIWRSFKKDIVVICGRSLCMGYTNFTFSSPEIVLRFAPDNK